MKRIICAIAHSCWSRRVALKLPTLAWPWHFIAERFVTQTAVAADFTGNGRIDVIANDVTPKNDKLMLYVGPDWNP